MLDIAGGQEFDPFRTKWLAQAAVLLLCYPMRPTVGLIGLARFRLAHYVCLQVAVQWGTTVSGGTLADVEKELHGQYASPELGRHVILVRTMSDLEGEQTATTADLVAWCAQRKMCFVECSALTGRNVGLLFDLAAMLGLAHALPQANRLK
jgi:hypothetical protein